MVFSKSNALKRALGAAGVCAASALAGCGWTQRDEFMVSRGVTVRPHAGDGSEITSGFRASPGSRPAATEMATRWDR